MAREFNKKRTFKKGKGKKKDSYPEKKSFHEKTFGRSNEKKGFDPNEDLAHGKESYSVRKRKNLLDEERKAPFEKPAYADEKKSFGKPDGRGGKKFGKSFKKQGKPFAKGKNTYSKRNDDDRGEQPSRFSSKPFGGSFNPSDYSDVRDVRKDKGFKRRDDDREERPYSRDKVPFEKKSFEKKPFEKPFGKFAKSDAAKPGEEKKPFKRKFIKRSAGPAYKKLTEQDESISDGLIRLNKYIANAGICSRREADELISAGAVSVNGKVVTEMGYKVKPDDRINYGGETLRKEKLVYVLLNKPKDFITTLDDPADRKTVFDLVKNACRERIYPVGRLDRNTTGVLLLTNDGDLTKKLTHPKHGIKKVYMVTLDKPLNKPDFDEIANNGVTLEDGHIKPDMISYVGDGSSKKEVGLEIHSGRNRVVRRLFEQFGYTVVKLDRVIFAGLTKKDLPRGNWRMLTEKEVSYLKMLG